MGSRGPDGGARSDEDEASYSDTSDAPATAAAEPQHWRDRLDRVPWRPPTGPCWRPYPTYHSCKYDVLTSSGAPLESLHTGLPGVQSEATRSLWAEPRSLTLRPAYHAWHEVPSGVTAILMDRWREFRATGVQRWTKQAAPSSGAYAIGSAAAGGSGSSSCRSAGGGVLIGVSTRRSTSTCAGHGVGALGVGVGEGEQDGGMPNAWDALDALHAAEDPIDGLHTGVAPIAPPSPSCLFAEGAQPSGLPRGAGGYKSIPWYMPPGNALRQHTDRVGVSSEREIRNLPDRATTVAGSGGGTGTGTGTDARTDGGDDGAGGAGGTTLMVREPHGSVGVPAAMPAVLPAFSAYEAACMSSGVVHRLLGQLSAEKFREHQERQRLHASTRAREQLAQHQRRRIDAANGGVDLFLWSERHSGDTGSEQTRDIAVDMTDGACSGGAVAIGAESRLEAGLDTAGVGQSEGSGTEEVEAGQVCVELPEGALPGTLVTVETSAQAGGVARVRVPASCPGRQLRVPVGALMPGESDGDGGESESDDSGSWTEYNSAQSVDKSLATPGAFDAGWKRVPRGRRSRLRVRARFDQRHIKWKFISPDGKVYRNAKKAIAAIAQAAAQQAAIAEAAQAAIAQAAAEQPARERQERKESRHRLRESKWERRALRSSAQVCGRDRQGGDAETCAMDEEMARPAATTMRHDLHAPVPSSKVASSRRESQALPRSVRRSSRFLAGDAVAGDTVESLATDHVQALARPTQTRRSTRRKACSSANDASAPAVTTVDGVGEGTEADAEAVIEATGVVERREVDEGGAVEGVTLTATSSTHPDDVRDVLLSLPSFPAIASATVASSAAAASVADDTEVAPSCAPSTSLPAMVSTDRSPTDAACTCIDAPSGLATALVVHRAVSGAGYDANDPASGINRDTDGRSGGEMEAHSFKEGGEGVSSWREGDVPGHSVDDVARIRSDVAAALGNREHVWVQPPSTAMAGSCFRVVVSGYTLMVRLKSHWGGGPIRISQPWLRLPATTSTHTTVGVSSANGKGAAPTGALELAPAAEPLRAASEPDYLERVPACAATPQHGSIRAEARLWERLENRWEVLLPQGTWPGSVLFAEVESPKLNPEFGPCAVPTALGDVPSTNVGRLATDCGPTSPCLVALHVPQGCGAGDRLAFGVRLPQPLASTAHTRAPSPPPPPTSAPMRPVCSPVAAPATCGVRLESARPLARLLATAAAVGSCDITGNGLEGVDASDSERGDDDTVDHHPPAAADWAGQDPIPCLTASLVADSAGLQRFAVVLPAKLPQTRLISVFASGRRCHLPVPKAALPEETLLCAPSWPRPGAPPTAEASASVAATFDATLPASVSEGQTVCAHTPNGLLVSFTVPALVPESRKVRIALTAVTLGEACSGWQGHEAVEVEVVRTFTGLSAEHAYIRARDT